ncbi:MAG: LPS export ABC transporter ATP-binding protein [Bacteroidetes bacterium]|nr:LPS export ABC transporter ATP-binding protein [Bacteroidota bacterium]MBK8658783.1 LPS export ABC transporter ATP-binding protein [Bacteroidota bacterium]
MQLRSEHLVKVYRNRAVVNDVSVEVNQGEIVGLLGPNGAGKTTSFYQIVGLIPPDSGKIFLGNKEITDLPMYQRSQLGVGYLPQEASVFRHLSVEDNIAAVLEMTSLSKSAQKERLELLLSEFGLNRVRKSMGNVLSGGERRRTEIARALATDPKFILLDEPFAGIDPIAVEDIQRIVMKLKEKNIGVLITDHNVQETLSITDRAYLLFEGKILKAGTAEELASDEQVRKVYLGQNFVLHRKAITLQNQSREKPVLNAASLARYTKDMLRETDRFNEILNSGDLRMPYTALQTAGFADFLSSLREYKGMLQDFAKNQNLNELGGAVEALTVMEDSTTTGNYLRFITDNFFKRGKYSDYLLNTKSVLNQISAQLLLIGAEV